MSVEKFYESLSNYELAKLRDSLREIYTMKKRDYYVNNQEKFLSDLIDLGFKKEDFLGWMYPYNHENSDDEFKPTNSDDFKWNRHNKLCFTIVNLDAVISKRFVEIFK